MKNERGEKSTTMEALILKSRGLIMTEFELSFGTDALKSSLVEPSQESADPFSLDFDAPSLGDSFSFDLFNHELEDVMSEEKSSGSIQLLPFVPAFENTHFGCVSAALTIPPPPPPDAFDPSAVGSAVSCPSVPCTTLIASSVVAVVPFPAPFTTSPVVAVAPGSSPRPPTPEAFGWRRMEIVFKYPDSVKHLHFDNRKCMILYLHAKWWFKLRLPRGFVPDGKSLVKLTLREFSQKVLAKETKFAINRRDVEDGQLVLTITAREENKVGPFPYTSFKDTTSIRAFQFCASFESSMCLSEPFLCDGNRHLYFDRKVDDWTKVQQDVVVHALIGLENSDFNFPTLPQVVVLPQLRSKLRADVKGHRWNEWLTDRYLRLCCNYGAHQTVDEVEFMSKDDQAYKLFYCPAEGEREDNFVFLECTETAANFAWRIVEEAQTGRNKHKVLSVYRSRVRLIFMFHRSLSLCRNRLLK